MSETVQAEKKVATGVCEEVSERNGWTAFAINVGTQYPIKLSTKKTEIIEAARAVGGELATWHYNESQGKENPNNPGTFYKNRYLEGVEVGGTAPASGSAPAPQQRPTESVHQPVSIGDKERSITRMACIKAAAVLFEGRGVVGVDTSVEGQDVTASVIASAARFERWVYRDLDDVPF